MSREKRTLITQKFTITLFRVKNTLKYFHIFLDDLELYNYLDDLACFKKLTTKIIRIEM